MRLSEICVQRPVFAFMLIMFLVVMGAFSFMGLGVDLFPRTDPATVYVRVRLPGASPEEVTSQVVLPIEEAVASVSGIDEMRAHVMEGTANIIVTFVLEKDIGEAAEDVREKVSGAMRRLPPNVLPPVVQKADPDSDPIVTLAVSGDRSIRELTEIADKQVRRALGSGQGRRHQHCGRAESAGQRVSDLDKLSGYNRNAQDVERAIRRRTSGLADGCARSTEMGVRTLGRRKRSGVPRHVIRTSVERPFACDVGYAEDGMTEKRTFAYYQDKPAVTLEARRQTGTNTVQVVDGILARVERLGRELPSGVKLDVVKEQATYIKSSVKALEEHLVIGSLLAADCGCSSATGDQSGGSSPFDFHHHDVRC
jgi:HAE1 family hydrophobic/amphiphilic exporter-1